MHSVRHHHTILRSFSALMVLMLAGCSESTLAPSSNSVTIPVSSPFRSAAFVVDVNTVSRATKVSPPTTGLSSAARLGSSPFAASQTVGNGAYPSLLGSDAIEMSISNYKAGAIGAVIPGKILLTFDLALTNRLNGVTLVSPTFPRPPAGRSGVQAFPFEISVVTSAGGVASSGNEVLVTSPSSGAVIASTDWDGEPHSFFNDASCEFGSNDCFRYEPFGTIGRDSAVVPRKVGFLIDPTVRDFRIRLLVAADLRAVVR